MLKLNNWFEMVVSIDRVRSQVHRRIKLGSGSSEEDQVRVNRFRGGQRGEGTGIVQGQGRHTSTVGMKEKQGYHSE